MYTDYRQQQSPLIDPAWLKDAIDKKLPTLVILDVSIPMPGEQRDCFQEFKDRHIPGARFLSLSQCCDKDSKNAYMLPMPEVFAEFMGKLGITNSSKIVLYDANEKKGMFSSPRGWYMLRAFGHADLHILNGGLLQWISAGFDTEEGDFTPPVPTKYTPAYHPELVKSMGDIKENIEKKEWMVIDARSDGRIAGTAPEPRKDIKPGKIPGSVGCFWVNLMDPESKTFKSKEEIQKLYSEKGINANARHVATCGTGVTACFLVLTSYILGNHNVPVYDGAWFDWYLNAPDDLKENVPQ